MSPFAFLSWRLVWGKCGISASMEISGGNVTADSRCTDGDGAIDRYLVGHDGLRHGMGRAGFDRYCPSLSRFGRIGVDIGLGHICHGVVAIKIVGGAGFHV